MHVDARWVVLPLLLLSSACGVEVIGGPMDDGSGGSGGGGGSSTGGAGANSAGGSGATSLGVALTRAQLDDLWDEYWQNDPTGGSTSSGSGGGGGGDMSPDDLFLHLSDLGAVCTSPTVDLPCGGHYEVSIALPPHYQAVGVYNLDDAFVSAYSSMYETGTQSSADPGDCPAGGGSLGSGTLEILSIDETQLHVVLTLEEGLWDHDPSGEYVLPRCP